MDKIVAVVIPTFNRFALTTRAVDSVVCKRPDVVEILVIDDCGTIPYEFHDPRNVAGASVKVLRASFNGGPGLARRMAVEQSHGDSIAFLDSDDVFDHAWLDTVLDEIYRVHPIYRDSTIIVGRARNGTIVNRVCLDILRLSPLPSKLVLARIVTVMFNPFYTSGIIVPKKLCEFDEYLRYCEDYYMNAMAIFRAKRIVVLPTFAASIARKPGSSGGLSGMKRRMFDGEMAVRRAMFASKNVPTLYKALVPVGMLYQLVRTTFKALVGL